MAPIPADLSQNDNGPDGRFERVLFPDAPNRSAPRHKSAEELNRELRHLDRKIEWHSQHKQDGTTQCINRYEAARDKVLEQLEALAASTA